MKQFRIVLITAAIILIASTSVVALWLIHHQSPARLTGDQESNKQASTKQEIIFKWQGVFDFIDENGLISSSQGFVSTDGVGVFLMSTNCGSAMKADRTLQEKLREATKIIEREILLDEKGMQIGVRVVAHFNNETNKKTIIRTDGKMFYRIESSSLEHVFSLEKQLFHNGPQPDLRH